MSTTAQDHINFANGLTSQTIEVLRILEKRNEESKKKVRHWTPLQLPNISLFCLAQEMAFFQKLLSDRDRVYADRIKVCIVIRSIVCQTLNFI